MASRRKLLPRLPRFRPDVLAAVNTMERSLDPLAVATAALTLHAVAGRPVPNYAAWRAAPDHADVVLAALYRRGMLP